MKLYQLLFESFVHEPRDLNLFMLNLSKEIKKREEKIVSLSKQLKFETDNTSDKEDKEYYFQKILNIATNYKYDSEHLQYAIRTLKNALKPYDQHIADNIAELFSFAKTATNSYDKFNMLSYIVKALERFQNDLEESLSYMQGFVAADFSEGWEDYKEFYSSDITLVVKEIAKEYVELYQYIKDYVLPKLSRLMQRRHARTDKDMAQKSIEPVETLYHATVNATQLLKTGFKTDYRQSVEGIGGSNMDESGKPAVSFTSDLYVAKEIARCLKEAIMIAKGELDIYDIKTMALQSGAAEEVEKAFPYYSKDENLKNVKPKDVFEYYRYYLAFSKRYDPVFFDSAHLMELFKNKKVEDVGILVCKVNMQDPNIKYLQAMEEYRIAPENVISIEKVLK